MSRRAAVCGSRSTPFVVLGLALFVLFGPMGCDGGGRSGVTPVAVPDPDLSDMEPQVASLLRSAREAVVRNTESSEAWGELGSVYDAHGVQEPAGICYRRAHELAPEDFRWAYLYAALRELGGAEPDEIVRLFTEASRLRPDYAPIYVRLGDAMSLRGEHEQATRHFRRAIELDPGIAIAHRGLGQVLLARNEAREAVEHLTTAVELEPRDLSAHSTLAQAYMRLGEHERARQVIEASKGLQPINAFADPVYGSQVFMRSVSSSRAFSRAMAEIRDGEYDRAIADLNLVLKARPEDASTHHWLGTAHASKGEADSAVRHFGRAVELQPAMVKSRMALAGLLTAAGKLDEAEAHYRRALKTSPNDAVVHLSIAYVLLKKGTPENVDEAVERCREALRLQPGNADAQALLTQALAR